MRYITIIIVIMTYWFVLALGLNLLLQDEFIIAEGISGNTTLLLPDAANINMSTENFSETTSLRNWIEPLRIMFTFRNPIPNALPSTVKWILTIVNWALVIFGIIAVYRIANPVSGG